MQNFVSWNTSYNVGVDKVDKQHRHLVNLINYLYNACLGDKTELDETFKEVMKELVEYVMVHFRDEEVIMESIHYPGFQEHKQKHEQFVKEILTAVNDFKEGQKFVPDNFAFFLRDWLFNHILMTDKVMAKYYLAQK